MMTRTAINHISREYRIDSNANLSSDILEALKRIDEFGPYGYRPNLIGSILFCIVFGLLAIILTFQNVKGKSYWFLFTLAFGSWCECVGNGLRIYGHFHPKNEDPYIAQQCILVLTPALFAAAHYSILTKMCQMYGSNLIAPFKPSWLIPMFVTLDLGSLAIQGAGSGLAATAEIDNHPVDDINNQGDIVLAGLAIQLAGYLTFNTLFILFIKRALVEKQKRKSKLVYFSSKSFLFSRFHLCFTRFRTFCFSYSRDGIRMGRRSCNNGMVLSCFRCKLCCFGSLDRYCDLSCSFFTRS